MSCERCGGWTFHWMGDPHKCPQDFARKLYTQEEGWLSVAEPHSHEEWLEAYDECHRVNHDFPSFAWPR